MIVDLHCDTLMELVRDPQVSLVDRDGYLNLNKMDQGQALAQCFAIFTPPTERLQQRLGEEMTQHIYHGMALEAFHRAMSDHVDRIRPAYTVSDIRRSHELGKLSAVLTLEDLGSCEGKADRIEAYYEEGARIMGFIWNNENALAYPNSRDPEVMNRGLKPFGLEVVEQLNALRCIMDVSHLNDGGFWDVLEHSTQPIVATHSNARAVTNHPRNLTDEMLRALAEKGGVTGLNFYHGFLHEDTADKLSTFEQAARHACHIVNVAGSDALALGSDFDGISSRLEWRDWSGMPELLNYLSRYLPEDTVEKIAHRNALRVMEEVWGN